MRTDSTISCWGNNPADPSTPPSGTFTQVSAGYNGFACAVRTDGSVVFWGIDERVNDVPSQSINFISTPPVSPIVGGSYTVAATGGGSGNPVTFTTLTAQTCSVSGSTVDFLAGGTCTVAADQAGSAGYFPAPQATQSVDVTVPANTAPFVSADRPTVRVPEGGVASNSGRMYDGDGDVVILMASVGTVRANSDGTWSWSFATSDGRIESQTVTITGDDRKGGAGRTAFTLTVDNVAPNVDAITLPLAPVSISAQPVTVTGTFSDPGTSHDTPYTCTVDYGDGNGGQPGSVSGSTCSGSHTYAAPGVYPVTLTVVDKDRASGRRTADAFVVIYDPSGGFVTGGGTFDSPAGAYAADPSLVGRATFGFVSKYLKGATVPTGNTEFQFKAGNFNFKSSSYEWLVVAGNSANFKGEGTINGTGLYKFMLWATDDDPDTFRIRITEVGGGRVYDNSVNRPILTGSIVIYK